MNGTPLPPKKEVAKALLERGSVHVHLDPRAGGVVVPAWFKRQAQLVLQVGWNMAVPIPDLRVDDDGMSCTLSFNRSPFFCIVPWTSVYAMVGDDGRGMVWPEDVPPEVALQARGRDAETTAKAPAAKRALTAVKTPEEAPRAASSKSSAKPRAVRAPSGAASPEKKPRTRKPRPHSAPAGRAAREPGESRNGRGGLTAVPPAERPRDAKATRPTPSPAPSPAARPTASADAPKPSPPSPTGKKPGAGKPKREIPPYLRVVK